jgi:hypothetical protein
MAAETPYLYEGECTHDHLQSLKGVDIIRKSASLKSDDSDDLNTYIRFPIQLYVLVTTFPKECGNAVGWSPLRGI